MSRHRRRRRDECHPYRGALLALGGTGFDTRFFVALAPPGQQAAHVGSETIDHAWRTPARVLADHRRDRARPTERSYAINQRIAE